MRLSEAQAEARSLSAHLLAMRLKVMAENVDTAPYLNWEQRRAALEEAARRLLLKPRVIA